VSSASYASGLMGTDGSESSYRAVDRAATVARDPADRAWGLGVAPVETVAVEGEPVDALSETVKERGIDLLVVSNRGLNSLAGRLLGSVTATISHKAACDVLLVHTTGKGAAGS